MPPAEDGATRLVDQAPENSHQQPAGAGADGAISAERAQEASSRCTLYEAVSNLRDDQAAAATQLEHGGPAIRGGRAVLGAPGAGMSMPRRASCEC